MRGYAAYTKVDPTRTKYEIEEMIKDHGGKNFASAENGNQGMVVFDIEDYRMVFKLHFPKSTDNEFQFTAGGHQRDGETANQFWENECKRLWRSLLLAIKSKLVSVEDGVETVQEAFMAHIVMPDGRTVAQHLEGEMTKRSKIAESPELRA